jgi:hypothetical protein
VWSVLEECEKDTIVQDHGSCQCPKGETTPKPCWDEISTRLAHDFHVWRVLKVEFSTRVIQYKVLIRVLVIVDTYSYGYEFE